MSKRFALSEAVEQHAHDLRREATWDGLIYIGAPVMVDTGCHYAPRCLECPFDVCRLEPAGDVRLARSRELREKALNLRASGKTPETIADELGKSKRTVYRLLAS